MNRIRIPIKAYILGLLPQSAGTGAGGPRTQRTGQQLPALASGLAVPSFWTRPEINQAFAEANRIWTREAEIEFSPVVISERSEMVPPDENGMWAHFINHLTPQTRGIAVGFVHDLPSHEGGWGGGRIAVVSGQKARSGLPGFPGNLLAHELGHVLIDDPNHAYAGNVPSNLMYGRRHPRIVNAGMLNQRQVQLARQRALSI
jgi:hypothetical protein